MKSLFTCPHLHLTTKQPIIHRTHTPCVKSSAEKHPASTALQASVGIICIRRPDQIDGPCQRLKMAYSKKRYAILARQKKKTRVLRYSIYPDQSH